MTAGIAGAGWAIRIGRFIETSEVDSYSDYASFV